jgi:hypothetical protein
MPRRQLLETLRAQQVALEHKIKELSVKERDRKASEDNRRSLVVGAITRSRMAADPEFAAIMHTVLSAEVRSNADRKLLNLHPTVQEGNGGPADDP